MEIEKVQSFARIPPSHFILRTASVTSTKKEKVRTKVYSTYTFKFARKATLTHTLTSKGPPQISTSVRFKVGEVKFKNENRSRQRIPQH